MTKTIKVSFLAYVNNADMATIKDTLSKHGAKSISEDFPELWNIGYFDVTNITNNESKTDWEDYEVETGRIIKEAQEVVVSFVAQVKSEDVENVTSGFNHDGAEIIACEYPELWDIGYFEVSVIN